MAKFYDMLPKFEYNGVLMTDITKNFKMIDLTEQLSNAYLSIDIEDGSTPESVSLDAYGSTDYWWLVLLANGVIDPFYDWLMSESEVYSYCEKMYDDINGIHHWEDTEFIIYQTDSPEMNRTPITNLEHTIHENDKKRRISLIRADDIGKIEKELKLSIDSSRSRKS